MSIYQPLRDEDGRSHLRLLRLQPGDADDDIECTLETVTYEDSDNRYEAISYCWGDAEDTVPITCNGVQTVVTRSLHGALRRFRPPRGTAARLLWADALCINQEDKEEKGKQVGKMGEVFANASRVLVWLGSNVDDTTAVDTFAMICEINHYLDEVFVQFQRDLDRMPILSKPYPICLEEDKWLGVAALLESPWFSRVWTIQEAALAKECTMFWGNAEIDAADVVELCLWCCFKMDLEDIVERDFAQVPRTSRVWLKFHIYVRYRSGSSRSEQWFLNRPLSAFLGEGSADSVWLHLLIYCSFMDATDARDYIYAFLGCPAAKSDNGLPYVYADYTISKDELYKRVAQTLLRDPKEGPWLLCAAGCSDREELLRSYTPSWIPCWDTLRRIVRVLHYRSDFKAGGLGSLLQREEQDGATLSVRGQFFDEVTWMSDIIESGSFLIAQNQPGVEPYIDKLWDQISRQMSKIGKVLQHEDFFRTLVRHFHSIESTLEASYMRRMSAYLKSVGSKVVVNMPQEPPTHVQHNVLDVLDVELDLNHISDSRVIVTLQGRIGLVPAPTTRLGDTLCIFHGVSLPFVLAPTTDGRFKLAGQAYIHGVMRGELVDQSEAENILLE